MSFHPKLKVWCGQGSFGVPECKGVMMVAVVSVLRGVQSVRWLCGMSAGVVWNDLH